MIYQVMSFDDLEWGDPYFKGTPLFDVEYLKNGTRYTLLQWKTTRNLCPTKPYNLEWPWVTTSDSKIFKNTERRAAALRQLSFLFYYDFPSGPKTEFILNVVWSGIKEIVYLRCFAHVMWRTLRPSAGQAQQWVSEFCMPLAHEWQETSDFELVARHY